MIGLDTNILLRAVLNDDVVQSPIARGILARLTVEEPGFVSIVTVVEFAWSLRSRYKKPQEAIRAAFEALLRNPTIVFSNRDFVNAAVVTKEHDFADALLHAECRHAGCKTIFTFDSSALRHADFQPAGA